MKQLTTKNKIIILCISIIFCMQSLYVMYIFRIGLLAKNIPTDTNYVIMSSYFIRKTFIYDKTQNYKCIKKFNSCGAKDLHRGKYKLIKDKQYYSNGSLKNKNGKSEYHEYFVYYYTNNNYKAAFHTILYKGEYNKSNNLILYHNTKNKVQNSKKPFRHHWSRGCTRLLYEDAKWIYDNCKSGTGYGIVR